MASTKGVPQVQRKSGGDAWHSHTYYEDMNSTELKAYQDGINNYNAMLKRQEAHMEKRWAGLAAQQSQPTADRKGCVFAKCSNLPNQVINYNEPNGFVPVDSLGDYGNFAILGGREADSFGWVPLEKTAAPFQLDWGLWPWAALRLVPLLLQLQGSQLSLLSVRLLDLSPCYGRRRWQTMRYTPKTNCAHSSKHAHECACM